MELERDEGQGRARVGREPEAERNVQLLLLLSGRGKRVGVGIVHADHFRQLFRRFTTNRFPALQKFAANLVHLLASDKDARLAQKSVADAIHPGRLGVGDGLFFVQVLCTVRGSPFDSRSATLKKTLSRFLRIIGIIAQSARDDEILRRATDAALEVQRRELHREVELVKEVTGTHERDRDRAGAEARLADVLGHSLHGKGGVLGNAELKERNRRVVRQVSVHGTDGHNGGNVGSSGHLFSTQV